MEHKGFNRKRETKLSDRNVSSLSHVFSDFCQSTSGHGFKYWVSSDSDFEKLLWVAIVAFGFSAASIILHSAVTNWINNKGSVTIKTFSKPANEVPYPAITVCNQKGYDFGQYLRAVFDNFQYSCVKDINCSETQLIRSHFPAYFDLGFRSQVCCIFHYKKVVW